MKILSFFQSSAVPRAICLGRFDGLHKGHISLIDAARSFRDLKPALFTIKSAEPSRDILTFSELLSACDKAGIETVIAANADKEFFSTAPKDFLNALKDRFAVKAVVCGEDFTYGNARSGNTETLKDYCSANGIDLRVIKTVTLNGEKVSSSKIKEALTLGDITRANSMLGRPYFISGIVGRGRGDGAKLGFKTANIDYPQDKTEIKSGVYATETIIEGKKYKSVTNVGASLTFGQSRPVVETHVLNFDGDLYGQNIIIQFNVFLRDGIKFSSAKELKAQIEKDIKYYD